MGADGHSLLGLQYRINRVCTAVKNSISVKCQSVQCQVSKCQVSSVETEKERNDVQGYHQS